MKLPNLVDADCDRWEVIDKLKGKKRHMRQLGSGAFARVFGRPNFRYVVKVGCGYDKYLKYVAMVGLRNPNPYLPTIHSVERFKYKTDEVDSYGRRLSWDDDFYYVIKMEKLVKWGKVPQRTRIKCLKKLGCSHLWEADDLKATKSSGRWEKEAIRLLNRLWSNYEIGADVHQGNIMFRKKGRGYQLVYTDPAA